MLKTWTCAAGRVKTLHPGVHAGILAKRDDPAHIDAMAKQGLSLIDVVRILTSSGSQRHVHE